MDHSDEETTETSGGDELTEATQQVRSIRDMLRMSVARGRVTPPRGR